MYGTLGKLLTSQSAIYPDQVNKHGVWLIMELYMYCNNTFKRQKYYVT